MLDYTLYFDQGGASYVVLASQISGTSYTATGLTSNVQYKFKVVARNIVGISAFSSEVQILCSRIPDAPVNLQNNGAVTTSSIIGFTWSAGASNGGSPVIDYRISSDQASNSWITIASGVPTLAY